MHKQILFSNSRAQLSFIDINCLKSLWFEFPHHFFSHLFAFFYKRNGTVWFHILRVFFQECVISFSLIHLPVICSPCSVLASIFYNTKINIVMFLQCFVKNILQARLRGYLDDSCSSLRDFSIAVKKDKMLNHWISLLISVILPPTVSSNPPSFWICCLWFEMVGYPSSPTIYGCFMRVNKSYWYLLFSKSARYLSLCSNVTAPAVLLAK